jgi:hypothetical protein
VTEVVGSCGTGAGAFGGHHFWRSCLHEGGGVVSLARRGMTALAGPKSRLIELPVQPTCRCWRTTFS